MTDEWLIGHESALVAGAAQEWRTILQSLLDVEKEVVGLWPMSHSSVMSDGAVEHPIIHKWTEEKNLKKKWGNEVQKNLSGEVHLSS